MPALRFLFFGLTILFAALAPCSLSADEGFAGALRWRNVGPFRGGRVESRVLARGFGDPGLHAPGPRRDRRRRTHHLRPGRRPDPDVAVEPREHRRTGRGRQAAERRRRLPRHQLRAATHPPRGRRRDRPRPVVRDRHRRARVAALPDARPARAAARSATPRADRASRPSPVPLHLRSRTSSSSCSRTSAIAPGRTAGDPSPSSRRWGNA